MWVDYIRKKEANKKGENKDTGTVQALAHQQPGRHVFRAVCVQQTDVSNVLVVCVYSPRDSDIELTRAYKP